ncbi:type IV pilus assembly protein PilM [Patescibacteria group bacterium]|nr:type IV pilus assembly protein PilM [Patescibacteria group bacterium]MBU1420925.1 type IV pilus assembly protein PilM [Patescibacteria group bacterium]MBU2415691.1 type IV pilus assembly protein PilM [Patescibacteria group bacterium]MBU2456538.1 type IV pilus assembly protein PilM [Patescibacteria group bacterium]MBU2474594.1 type IV pilus assembly protein PilM [Patescibacteria group bacterium]
MNFLNYNTSNYPIGLDISDLSLKLIQLSKIKNKTKIQALNDVALAEGLIVNGEIKNQKKVAEIIKQLVSSSKYGEATSKSVVACLPETKTFIKLVEIKEISNDLSAAVAHEIEKYFPLPLDEIYYDWQVIENHNNIRSVLIGAAPKNIVDQYISLLADANLSIEALEIEPVALCRSLLYEESYDFHGNDKKNYAIIDIGATRSSLILYSRNTILFTVSMPISGREITKNLSEIFKIKKAHAEKIKIIGRLAQNKVQKIINNSLSDMISNLNKKIKEAIKFYNNHFSDRGPLNNILLCGGGTNIRNIDKIISGSLRSNLNIEIKKGDSLIHINEEKKMLSKLFSEKHVFNLKILQKQKATKLSITQDASLRFATAIGLALRGIFVDEI